MTRDPERIERVIALMTEKGFDALICQMPHNVLMLSGYYPVLAQSMAIILPDGDGAVIAPESELFFARDGWFRDIHTFKPVTLDYVLSPVDTALPLLAKVCCEKGVARGILGIEGRPATVTAPYPELYIPSCAFGSRLVRILPSADLRDATDLLEEAAAIKSSREIERVQIACKLGEYGFEAARNAIGAGVREVEVASFARTAVEVMGTGRAGVRRVGAWAFCMSGERSADAHMPYQYSTNRHLQAGDSVVVHINCHVDGYWTNLTRTFFVEEPSPEQRDAYDGMLYAWERAVGTVGRNVKALDVDAAARFALGERGYGDAFVHGTGHGVGLKAIYHGDRPVIHPQSDDVLQNDMVFNIEPGVYLPERWGMRVCDVVSVRGDEGKVLSDMRRDIDWAICAAT